MAITSIFFESVTNRQTWAILQRFYYIQKLLTYYFNIFRFRIPNVTERLRRYSEGRTLSSNLVFTIWAVFGGFILHFLLSNYLTVLLTPSYEEPVETAKDLIKRDITPFCGFGGEIWRQFFAASNDTDYQEISQRLVIPNHRVEFEDMHSKILSTGMYAYMGTMPLGPIDEYKKWYRSTETIEGGNKYDVHLSNKKWPLKKVL